MVWLQIQKKDGSAMPAVNNCVTGTVNLLLHSLFKEVTVQFNNKIVSDYNIMYAYRSYIKTLLNCSSDVQSYRLKAKGLHKDTYDKMDESEPKDHKGLLEREEYCAESPEVVLIGRPHMDVFHIDKLIPPESMWPSNLCETMTSLCLLPAMVII